MTVRGEDDLVDREKAYLDYITKYNDLAQFLLHVAVVQLIFIV